MAFIYLILDEDDRVLYGPLLNVWTISDILARILETGLGDEAFQKRIRSSCSRSSSRCSRSRSQNRSSSKNRDVSSGSISSRRSSTSNATGTSDNEQDELEQDENDGGGQSGWILRCLSNGHYIRGDQTVIVSGIYQLIKEEEEEQEVSEGGSSIGVGSEGNRVRGYLKAAEDRRLLQPATRKQKNKLEKNQKEKKEMQHTNNKEDNDIEVISADEVELNDTVIVKEELKVPSSASAPPPASSKVKWKVDIGSVSIPKLTSRKRDSASSISSSTVTSTRSTRKGSNASSTFSYSTSSQQIHHHHHHGSLKSALVRPVMSNEAVQFQSIHQLLNVVRMGIPLLEEIDRLLPKSTTTNNNSNNNNSFDNNTSEKIDKRRPLSWRKRIEALAPSHSSSSIRVSPNMREYQPDLRNVVTRKHVIELLLLLTTEVIRARSVLLSHEGQDNEDESINHHHYNNNQQNSLNLIQLLVGFARVWEPQLNINKPSSSSSSPYQTYYYETIYHDVIPRCRGSSINGGADQVNRLLHMVDSIRRQQSYSSTRAVVNKGISSNSPLLKALNYDDYKAFKNYQEHQFPHHNSHHSHQHHVHHNQLLQFNDKLSSTSPYRPIDPTYAFKACKNRVLIAMRAAKLYSDGDLELLFEACIRLEEELLGPFGIYPAVYVKERLCREFEVVCTKGIKYNDEDEEVDDEVDKESFCERESIQHCNLLLQHTN